MRRLIIIIVLVLGWSVYSPSKDLNSTPLATFYYARSGSITADGSKVHPEEVKTGEHRWIAVSRDLKRSGKFSFGDTVLIQSKKCPGLNGEWIVKDLMGSKHTNRIDFLLHREEIDSLRFWMPHRVEIVNKKDSLNPLETSD